MSEYVNKNRCNSFIKLLAANENRLNRFVLTLVPSWNDAEDIVQETKLRLWEQYDSYDTDKDFGSWACTIAYFQILTHRNRSSRSRIIFSQNLVDHLSRDLAGAAAKTDSRFDYLEQCIKKLSRWQRDLLLRSCDEDYTSQKVASQLGRTAEAIRQSLLRIRRKLYRCIEDVRQKEVTHS